MPNQHANYDYKQFVSLANAESLQSLIEHLLENDSLNEGDCNNQYAIKYCDREIHLHDKENDQNIIVSKSSVYKLIDLADRRIKNLCDGLDYHTYTARNMAREKEK